NAPTTNDSGSSAPPASSSASAPAVPRKKPARLTGSALARSATGAALYLADEDAGVLRRLGLPLAAADQGTEIKLSGPPAQVIARENELLVTVRDPGL